MKKSTLIFVSAALLLLVALSGYAADELYPPEKITPSNGQENVSSPVHFEWRADGSGTDKYQILIYEGNTANLIKERVDGKSKLHFDYDLPDGEYRWYVKSCKSKNVFGHDCDNRDFGSSYHFTVGETSGAGDNEPSGGQPSGDDSGDGSGGRNSSGGQGSSRELEPPIKAKTFEELINTIINFVFWIGVAVAPVMALIAGIMYMTGGGDPTKIGKAHKLLIYTGVGFVIILFAKGLIALLGSVLGE